MGEIILNEGPNELNVQMTPIPAAVATLYGIVTDAETGYAIPGVKVTLNGLIATTDSIGRYAFEGLAVGSYMMTFEKEGYQPLA